MSTQLEDLKNAIDTLQKSVNDLSATIKRIEQRLAMPPRGYVVHDFGVQRNFGHKQHVEYVPEDISKRAWPVPQDDYSYPRVRFPRE